uniref:Uncharacterized protein n=1 Tax=Anguilla anguilla TaxID=7936 RepID=A0A0E9VTI2_ANGAN
MCLKYCNIGNTNNIKFLLGRETVDF